MENNEQLLTRSLLKKIGPVDMDLVIGEVKVGDKHLLKINNKRIDDAEATGLKREAEILEQMKLWRIFTETLRYQAHVRMFEQSQKSEDVYVSGKFLLHAISTLEHIIWSCKNPLLLSDQKTQLRKFDKKKLQSNMITK